MPIQAKAILAILLFLIGLVAGWNVKGAFVAKRDLAILEAKTEFLNIYRENEAKQASVLEEKLASLKANERVIEREKLKIINRDVYRNECIDADGVQLIERARAGKADSIQPTN